MLTLSKLKVVRLVPSFSLHLNSECFIAYMCVSPVRAVAMLQDLVMQSVLCRLAAQVSQYYKDIEELDSVQQLRKYLGQVVISHLDKKL